jgi:hypothetical protein
MLYLTAGSELILLTKTVLIVYLVNCKRGRWDLVTITYYRICSVYQTQRCDTYENSIMSSNAGVVDDQSPMYTTRPIDICHQSRMNERTRAELITLNAHEEHCRRARETVLECQQPLWLQQFANSISSTCAVADIRAAAAVRPTVVVIDPMDVAL